jgi:hypothetical protein
MRSFEAIIIPVIFGAIAQVEAFFATSPIHRPYRVHHGIIALYQTRQNEENTRRAFNEKNSMVSREAEVTYSSTIGEGVDLDEELRFYGLPVDEQVKEGLSSETIFQDKTANQKTSKTTNHIQSVPSPLQREHKNNIVKSIERMTKPRAYPLFLLEKLAIFSEHAVTSLTSNGKGYTNDFFVTSGYHIEKRTKERLVVLGTGWGAAAFLKDIDTDLFDVTVISPRNFFLFTPMLAGACVGTVEFRTITEPIREVCR